MKNRMGKKSAYTLVEIIVSITLLAVVAMIFANFLVYGYKIQQSEKNVTKSAFELQKNIEQEMEKKKKDGSLVYAVANDVFIDGHQVEYYQVDVAGRSHTFHTLVPQKKQKQEVIPECISSKLSIQCGDGTKTAVEYRPFDSSNDIYDIKPYKLDGKFILNENKNNNLAFISIKWYMSKIGYSVPYVSDYVLGAYQEIYPRFPDDYELIEHKVLDDIAARSVVFEGDLNNLSGRNVVLSVTPITYLGVFGVEQISDPVYIHPLPALDKLILHLDASLIKKDGLIPGGNLVATWHDKSNFKSDGQIVGVSELIKGYKKPEMVSFSGYGVRMYQNDVLTSSVKANAGDLVTVFVFSKGNYTTTGLSLNNPTLVKSWGLTDGCNFYMIQGKLLENNKFELKINDPKVDILEISVYRDALVVDAGEQIKTYLDSKYNVITFDTEPIISMIDFTSYAVPGEEFVPPDSATAIFKDGKKRAVRVVWTVTPTIEKFNFTNANIEYVFEGHAEIDSTKIVKMTVISNPFPLQVDFNPVLLHMFKGTTQEIEYEVKSEGAINLPDGVPVNVKFTSKNPSVALLVNDSGNKVESLTSTGKKGKVKVFCEDWGNADIEISTMGFTKICKVEPKLKPTVRYESKDENMVYETGKKIKEWHNSIDVNNTMSKVNGKGLPELLAEGVKFVDGDLLYSEGDMGSIDFKKSSNGKKPDSTIAFVVELDNKFLGNIFFSQCGVSGSPYTIGLKYNNVLKTNEISISSDSSVVPALYTRTTISYDDEYNKLYGDKAIIVLTNSTEEAGSSKFKVLLYAFGRASGDDGIFKSSQKELKLMDYGATGFSLGGIKENANAIGKFNGKIYEVMIFDRVLQENEILFIGEYLKSKWYH